MAAVWKASAFVHALQDVGVANAAAAKANAEVTTLLARALSNLTTRVNAIDRKVETPAGQPRIGQLVAETADIAKAGNGDHDS
jgi:hypothetical protein